ncbi:hypothetical protein ACVWZK_002222 [Bradyrhizobium sp. GM0.4]
MITSSTSAGSTLGAVDQLVQHLRGEIGRMPSGEAAPLAPTGGTRSGDDISLGHVGFSLDYFERLVVGAGFKGRPVV